jgi:hypothetical protein
VSKSATMVFAGWTVGLGHSCTCVPNLLRTLAFTAATFTVFQTIERGKSCSSGGGGLVGLILIILLVLFLLQVIHL